MQAIVNNLACSYIREGSGPVALVLHGWGTSAENMRSVIDVLKATHTVIAPDLPGFGATEVPQQAWGVGEYVTFVRALLEKIGCEMPVLVVGHSFGGRMTIKSVSEGVFGPDKIVLIGSAGVKHSDSARNRTYKMVAKTGKIALKVPGLRGVAQKARKKLYQRAGSVDYVKSGPMKDIFLKVIDEDLSENAAQITTDALLIWGSEDHEAPLTDAEYFDRVMQHSRLEVIEGAGHFVHTTHQIQVKQWLEEFC